MVRVSAGETGLDLHVVVLSDGRYGAALPPGVPWLADGGEVGLEVGDDHVRPAAATVVRSGRAHRETTGRLAEERGPLARLLPHRRDAGPVLLLDLGQANRA